MKESTRAKGMGRHRGANGLDFMVCFSRRLCCCCLLVSSARSATVNFTQTSVNDVDGSVIAAVSSSEFLESGISCPTVAAPAMWSSFRFTHWTNSTAPAASYRDAWGRSLNPISIVLLEDTTATAHYLPASRDSDGDSVPDWHEIEFFGNLSRAANDDSDGDGILLLAEYGSGSHPRFANATAAGGIGWTDSSLITVNLAGFHSYLLRSVPAGTVDESAVVPSGTVVTTPNLTQASFGYWTVDGLRQQDPWGVALRQLTFTVDSADREGVAWLFTGDSDGDGVPDAYEQYYFGTLAHGAASDTDGDGAGLLAESNAGTSPRFGNTAQAGGISWVDSGMVTVNLAGYSSYTLRSEPAGVVDEIGTEPDGSSVTTPAMAQAHFGFWTLDGVRQEDAWGVAERQVSFIVDGADREAVAYLYPADSDGDGVNDGFEQFYFGTLAHGASFDSDGDGAGLLVEYASGTNPRYGNQHQEGGVFWADSEMTVVNLQPFERLSKVLVLGVLTNFFSPDPAVVSGVQAGTWSSAATTDWDGDGDFDLFVAHEDGLRVFRNNGNPRVPNFEEVTTGFSGLASLVAAVDRPSLAGGDWSDDGLGDLVIGGNTGTLRLIASTGVFSSDGSGNDFATGSGKSLPALGDMDGDGRTDLVVLLADGTARFHVQDGSVFPFTMPGVANYLGVSVPSATGVATSDLDQDGRLDVLVADADGRIWEFHGLGGGGFVLTSKVWGGSGAGFAAGLTLASVDLDQDGDVDLIGGLANGGLVALVDPDVGRPTGLRAESGATTIRLDWDASWQSRIKGYRLHRALDPPEEWEGLTPSPLPLPGYLDTMVSAGTDYHYQVAAVSYLLLPGNSEPRLIESLPSDPVPATAGVVKLDLRPVRGSAGSFVDVPIAVNNSRDLKAAGLEIQVSYDPAVLTPATQVDALQLTVIRSGLTKFMLTGDNGASATETVVISGLSGEIASGAGRLFSLRFKIDEGAVLEQQTPVWFLSATFESVDDQPVAVLQGSPAMVTVAATFIQGDLTGEGVVSVADKDLLSQLVKPGSRPATANELIAGDLNADGFLKPDDLLLLQKLLQGLPLE